jgi:hypothetical protein
VHKHTIDWYRQTNITLDAATAEKRWATAEAVAKTLSRASAIELLRLFLFVPQNSDFTQRFTSDLVGLDAEFPVSKNMQDLRLMAGLVIMTTFAAPSGPGVALALGLRAACFPDGRAKAIQPAILSEAELYLLAQANRVRPENFSSDTLPGPTKTLTARSKALIEAEASGDAAQKTAALAAYREAVPGAVTASHKELVRRIEQLAEESALLWWILAEFSDTLQQPVGKLDQDTFALAAAIEAAQRTLRLPPPQSIGPLLARALQSCKASEKKFALSDYIKASNPMWRTPFVKSTRVTDCPDLSPVSAVLEKAEELGGAPALKALPKLCPGVKAEVPLIPAQAARQFYNEIIFLRALEVALD